MHDPPLPPSSLLIRLHRRDVASTSAPLGGKLRECLLLTFLLTFPPSAAILSNSHLLPSSWDTIATLDSSHLEPCYLVLETACLPPPPSISEPME